MKTPILKKVFITLALLAVSIFGIQAQNVLFETNFQAPEGWVAEGTSGTTGTLLNRTITYNETPYVIYFNQVEIKVTGGASGACSAGTATIQRNNKSYTSAAVSTDASYNGYILLPDFNKDIVVSFSYASSTTNRVLAIEYSTDNMVTWKCDAEDLAPMNTTGTCQTFESVKFKKDMRVRITCHSSSGGTSLNWLQVREAPATLSSAKDILSFKVPNQVGTEIINATDATVSLVVSSDADLTDLTPTIIVSPSATIDTDVKDFSAGSATYTVTAEDASTKIWTVNVTQNILKQATLPVIYKGSDVNSWLNIAADGWTKSLAGGDNTVKMNNLSFTTANINQAQYWIGNYFEAGANRISFRIRYGNATSDFKIRLLESADGDVWDEVAVYTPSNGEVPTTSAPDLTPMIPCSANTLGLRSYPLKLTSQYVKWVFDKRSNTSYYLDDVVIENVPEDTTIPTLSTDLGGNIPYTAYSTNTKAQIFLQFSEPVKVSEKLIRHETSIKLNGTDLYEDNILALRDGQLVLTGLDLPALGLALGVTITIPNDALVDLSNNAFVLNATSINESVKVALSVSVNAGVLILNEAVAKIEIIDVTGRTIKSAKQTNQMSVSELKGVYIIKCTSNDGTVKTVKTIL